MESGEGGTGILPVGGGVAVRRERAFAPRKGLRLDDDMGRAIAKLAELDRLIRQLPGRDCALCGAPSCRALAEDIVLGRGAAIADCRLLIADCQSEIRNQKSQMPGAGGHEERTR
ncbi:MAG: hypothetical protein FJ291_17645 [Planctomycetes bacterium]|nr:hypothetical protein [Planctomycetota bacterium]